ncbi:DUF563 domain-containing protein [Pseudomonadota bacterium]
MNDIFKKSAEKINKPYNFKKGDPEFKPFFNLKEIKVPGAKIIEFKNVKVASNFVVRKGFEFLKEPLLERRDADHYKSIKRKIRHFIKYIIPRRSPYKNKKHILFTNDWCTNYYHWHVEALGRLVIFHEKNLIKDSILLLPEKYKKIEFVQESLNAFSVKKEQILYVPRNSSLKVKKLLIAVCPINKKTKVSKTKEMLDKYFNEKMLKKSDASKYKNLGEKVYIARVPPYARRIENEEEVYNLLKKYDFKRVLMENFSYLDQVSIARNAKVICGPHGAGLTNILFMKRNSFVLEFLKKNNKSHENEFVTHFCKMSSMCDLNYLFQFCKHHGEEQSFHQGNMVVDLKKLEKNLKLMVESQ